MGTTKTRKTCLCALLTASLLLASSFSMFRVDSAHAQLDENSESLVSDTLIRGMVKGFHLDYENILSKVTYRLAALITVQITEIIERPENFCCGEKSIVVGDLVDVSYNYSSHPEVGVNDTVEVYGLWVAPPDLPASRTIRVDDYVVGSYVKTIAKGLKSDEQGESNSSTIDTQREYSSDSISHGPGVNLWYTWVNASGTQVIFFTYYSEIYNSPIQTFLGQHYQTVNETEVFIGNTLLLMEAYNDANENGVPESDLRTGTSEIKYFFVVNSSVGFIPESVQKVMIEDIPHYVWSIKYEWVDGFLLYPTDRIVNGVHTNLAARVNITHLGFTYEYYVQENISYIKTGFNVSRIVDFEPNAPDVSLDGLGLSLLYGTVMLTTKPYAVIVNGEPYNSKVAEAPITSTDRAEVIIGDAKLYELIFEENYTLYRDSNAETYVSKSAASPIESIPPNAANYLSPYWLVGSLLRILSDDVFPNMTASLPNLDLEYANSSFVYRVCYPAWEGWGIEHDPTYVAYLAGLAAPPVSPPAGPSIEMIAVVALAGLFALTLALIDLRKTRRILKIKPLTMRFRAGELL